MRTENSVQFNTEKLTAPDSSVKCWDQRARAGRVDWSSTTITEAEAEEAFHTRAVHSRGLGVLSVAWELLGAETDSVLVRTIRYENTARPARAITDFLPR